MDRYKAIEILKLYREEEYSWIDICEYFKISMNDIRNFIFPLIDDIDRIINEEDDDNYEIEELSFDHRKSLLSLDEQCIEFIRHEVFG